MTINNPLHTLRTLLLTIALAASVFPGLARGEEADDTLDLFNAFQEQTSSASRVPRPLSQTAENVTVITAKEIEALNAHTLADILDTVPGIQLQHNGGPGVPAYTYIQSADFIFSQVFIDGVSLSNLSSNYADVSSIPAQIIERVEVIKGAASASWGSALGGVINVITRSPEAGRPIGGSATASIGDRVTADTRAELSGTSGRLGYYLSGGYLGSNGLLPAMQIDSNHAYAKLTYSLPGKGQVWGTLNHSRANSGDLYYPPFNLMERSKVQHLRASVGLRHTIAEGLEFELTGRYSSMRSRNSPLYISDGTLRTDWPATASREQVAGASAKLSWTTSNNLLVGGSDYNNQELSSNTVRRIINPYTKEVDRWGIYVNDTLSLGPVSMTPGVRIDHTQTNGDQVSSSFGATWQVTANSLLRAYIGRGFGLPQLYAINFPTVKILTTQVGAESTALPFLWLKGTLFRNMTWGDGVERHLALGSEVEVRTAPVFNTSLGAGYTFTETTRTSDGTQVKPDKASHTVQLALRYDDRTYRAMLAGRHINWNSPPDANARYGGLVWDLHLGATLLDRENSSLELFFSGRNLFDGDPYNSDIFPNVGRWFEGGVKVSF
ncbi:MAG: TonB-dependent receptor [Desulfuromonadaceae bacterium]